MCTLAGSRWRHELIALLVGAIAFGVYLATVYPGLTNIGDASKFSFVGKILGTPHAPGYPLYVWTSHLFSYLPWGSLAYRMNVLSALWGAVAVGLGYLIAHRLGVRPAIAAATALSLGFGNAFWSRALYAKAYTLQAVLVSAGVLALITWASTRRRRDLLLAVAAFALSLGNHLTVIALLPVLVVFVFLVDRREALRPSTIGAVLLLVAAGFSQYLLILIRTWQKAPYLEASASNLHQLWAVMTARRFATEIGAFTTSAVLSERVPLVWGLITTELGAFGVLLFAFGWLSLLQRKWRIALLLGLGALGVAGLTANMGSEEDQGFMLSVFVLTWPVVGIGLDRALSLLQRVVDARILVAAPALALLLPAYQVSRNYRPNDHHAETFETAYFNALFSVLPNRALIVNDEYRFNMMVLYKLLGEGAGQQRQISLASAEIANLRRLRQQGRDIFAFEHGRNELTQYGFNFAPVEFAASPDTQAVLRGRSIFRLISTSTCFDIGNTGWTDVSTALEPKGRWSLKIDNYRAFDSTVTLYAGAEQRMAPAQFGAGGAGTPVLTTEKFSRDDQADAARLHARLATDRVTLPDAIMQAPFISRIEIRVNDKGAFLLMGVDEGAATAGAFARATVDLNNPKRATICSHPVGAVDAWPADQSRVTINADAGNVEFSGGWFAIERRPADNMVFRWMSDSAVLVVPIERPRDAIVRITAEPLTYPGRRGGAMTLVVNGYRFPARPLPDERTTLSWTVPLMHWRGGLNELKLEVEGAQRPSDVLDSKDRRMLGATVNRIDLDAVQDATSRASATRQGPLPARGRAPEAGPLLSRPPAR